MNTGYDTNILFWLVMTLFGMASVFIARQATNTVGQWRRRTVGVQTDPATTPVAQAATATSSTSPQRTIVNANVLVQGPVTYTGHHEAPRYQPLADHLLGATPT